MIPHEERPSNPCSRWASACFHFPSLPVSSTRTPMPTGPQRCLELLPCSWRQTCAFAFCTAGDSDRVVTVSLPGFGRGRPSVRPQAAPCLCRCGCRRVQSPEERRNAPLFSGMRNSPSVAGGVFTHVRRLRERPRAARASITRAGYPRGECAQRRGARAPAPQSGVLCRVRGAPRQRLGRVASGWQSRFGTATGQPSPPLPIAWRDFPVRCRLAIDCVPSPAWFDLSQGSKGCNSSDSFLRR